MTGFAELFALGFLASIFGSMVGLGGGFIVVPVLRLFFGASPAVAAGTSLALVLANSASGATTYLLQRRVHVRTGWYIAIGALPGSILGAVTVKHASPKLFDLLFALFLIAVAVDILLNRGKHASRREAAGDVAALGGMKWPIALGAGFAIGFISSLFGVGGGVILVPSLLYFSDLPAHAISATSHFGIVLTSPIGVVAHIVQHDIRWMDAIPLAAGGLLGGPLGARFSLKLRSDLLLRIVAVALVIAALALVFREATG